MCVSNGAPGAIRTRDLLIRNQLLYPTELRGHSLTKGKIYLDITKGTLS